MDFEDVIRKRTSVRKFSNKRLEQEKLDKILEAGRIAPTAKNLQPFKIFVINTLEGIKKIDKATKCRYNSSTILLVCGDKDKAYKKGDYSTYEMDSSIVATHMILEATNLGVDNIWVMMFDNDKTKEEFNLGENIEPICLIPIGYKTDDCPTNPQHDIRKDLSELVTYI